MEGGGVWAPFKELYSIVNASILRRDPEVYHSLDIQLKKHKPDFINLLKNPSKNASWRAKLQRAHEGGLNVPTLPTSLSQDLVAEALDLSDLLDLNEVSAVELLIAGEQQLPRFPTYSRMLLAFLLYHDGRRSIVAALRQLIQARDGVTWALNLPPATAALVNSFTEQLYREGVVDKILRLLDNISVERELERHAFLEKKGGGGTIGVVSDVGVALARHQEDIAGLVREQRQGLAECLLYWTSQTPFGKEETMKMIKYLRKVPVRTAHNCTPGTGGDESQGGGAIEGYLSRGVEEERLYGAMDPVSLCLFHTLLACFNIGDYTAENAVDDSLLDDDHRIVSDATYLQVVHKFITSEEVAWATPELRDTMLFAWGVLLRECGSRLVFADREELEEDERLVTQGIKGRAFLFLRRCVVAAPQFHGEDLYVKQIHWLLTSFIINNHLKIKELRNYGDELAKGVGRRVREVELGLGFSDLMMLIGDLYQDDPRNLQLATEFWPSAVSPRQRGTASMLSRAPHRQISLCKFLSTCSDFLPASLFCSFMHMLTGLSSSPLTARHAFNFLEANSPSFGGGGASAAMSLEHFFNSLRQYYHGLRGGGVSGPAPASGCGISPQEVHGLMAVLSIIGTIAKHDATARIMMYENQTWLPVATLFGLIGCPVPQELKAEIFKTLATFALSPDIATSMWHTLEVTQVLNTQQRMGLGGVGGGASYRQHLMKEGSIEVELRELECRNESYPMTQAFLELLLVLVKVPFPPTLGVGHRVPGFSPYLQFVRDTIFLEFDTRAYRDPDEKWKVGRLSLDILHTLLLSHELSAEDFGQEQTVKLPHGESVELPRPPGFTVLEHMLSDSLLLKKVLAVLHKALEVLQALDQATPSESLVCCALLCLKMLGAALEREAEFHDMMRKSPMLKKDVIPLYRLLSEVNPCSNRPDHMINIAQYVCQSRCPPELALDALLVLSGLCHTPKAGMDLAITLAGNKVMLGNVLHGLVEHLEWEEEVEGPGEDQNKDSLETGVGVHRAIQLQILKLLSSTVDRPAPNIAHLLLGFGTSSGSPSDITLQDPGVLGSPRTCLHSILVLVEHPQSQATPLQSVHNTHPQLAEICYKLLYQLCAHSALCTPTLRYLRNNHDFVYKQLSRLPLESLPQIVKSEDSDIPSLPTLSHLSMLRQQAWLLRIAAIELRVTLLNQQRSHAQRLLNLLLSESGGNGQATSSFSLGVYEGMEPKRLLGSPDGRRKLLVLLDLVDLEDYKRPVLELEWFDESAVEGVLNQCETKDEVTGATYCEVKVLHHLLMNELYAAQGAPQASQQEAILKEIHSILSVVVERNLVQAAAHLASEMVEAWRQVTEVTLHAMLQDGVKREMKMAVIFEVIQDLLLKVSRCESTSLTTAVQGVVLILLSHLRLAVLSHTGSSEQEDTLLPSLYSGPLLVIMRGLLESMLTAPASLQQLRAYLLGSLLYYLTLTQQPDTTVDAGPQSLWEVEKKREGMAEANLTTLNSFGEPLMDAVCKNACSGHDVTKMLSLSFLDAVVRSDWKCSWLKFLSQHGYLHNLCASLQWEDDGLKKMLDPVPEALRALYIYESKMAFLTRVADRLVGANELATIGAVNYLSQCRFIDLRPSHHTNTYYGNESYHAQSSRGFIPSILERYRQLLFPLLKFVLALLTCPGPHHNKVVAQVTALIEAHCDVFAAVLKEEVLGQTVSSLQELALVTAIIAQSGVALSVPDGPVGGAGGVASSGRLVMLQGLMLKLLPRFWSAQCCRKMVKLVLEGGEEEGAEIADEATLLVHRISSNVVTYCRVAMTMKGMEFSVPYSRILLSAELAEALTTPSTQDPFSSLAASSVGSQRPSLGLLVQHLRECVDSFMSTQDSHLQLLKKKELPGPLSSEDIRQFLVPSLSGDKLPVTQQQVLARRRLKALLLHKKKELQHFAYVVENLLFLLWQHLRFYLVHSKPGSSQMQFGSLSTNFSPMRRLDDISNVKLPNPRYDMSSLEQEISSADIDQLKVNLPRCLTDNFFKKLLEMEEIQLKDKSDSRNGFVQALVRRIKKLLKFKTY